MRNLRSMLSSLLAASFWCGFACFAQTSGTALLQAHTTLIEQATLLNANEGYVTAHNHIYYTKNLGSSWTEITPKAAKRDLLTNEFSSPNAGTVYYTDARALDEPATIQVFQTVTQGSSWSAVSTISEGTALKDFGGSAKSTSLDSKHVWLTVRKASSSAFSFSDLFSSVDGGKTWKLLPSPPVFGQLRFVSPTIGFLLGGYDDQELYRTTNGGQSWVQVQFVEEKVLTREIEVHVSLPRFENQFNGSVLVSVVKGSNTTTTAYGTVDGGANWFKTTARSLASTQASRLATDSTDPVTVQVQTGSNVYTSHVGGPAKVFALPKAKTDSFVSDASFSGDQVGWIVVHSGNSDTLMLTKDGGASYEDMTPESIRLQSGVVSQAGKQTQTSPVSSGSASPDAVAYPGPKQGWDQQVAPTFAQLDDWAFTAPFYTVGIYLGGSHYSSAAMAQSGLTPIYSLKLARLGYNMANIWVGPQADTTTFTSNLIPANPTDAYNLGYSEARLAVANASTKLGIQNGAIYFDLESYDPSTPFNIGRFFSGWTQSLHDQGWTAGVYMAAKNWGDVVQSNPEPDSVWVAYITSKTNPDDNSGFTDWDPCLTGFGTARSPHKGHVNEHFL